VGVWFARAMIVIIIDVLDGSAIAAEKAPLDDISFPVTPHD
jgi:hypothetical protein